MTDSDYRVKVAERLSAIETVQREMRDDISRQETQLDRIEEKLDTRLTRVETKINRFAGGVGVASFLFGALGIKLRDKWG